MLQASLYILSDKQWLVSCTGILSIDILPHHEVLSNICTSPLLQLILTAQRVDWAEKDLLTQGWISLVCPTPSQIAEGTAKPKRQVRCFPCAVQFHLEISFSVREIFENIVEVQCETSQIL